MNDNMQHNFKILLNEMVKLKEENLELKKQNDLKPFLKSILDMQLYSFNNVNSYKATITEMANVINDYKTKFFSDISEIKEYLNKTLIGTPEEKQKDNVFAEVLNEKKKDPKGGRFLEKSSKISLSLKKNNKRALKKDQSFFDN